MYNTNNDEEKRRISHIKDPEVLYVYAYNYNWDNGFDIPQAVLDNKNCDLGIALLIFYRADGFGYLTDKSDNTHLSQWLFFIKKLYNSILAGKYQKGKIGFKAPLSKVQLYNLKKVITEEEQIFIKEIDGKYMEADI